MNFKNTKLLEEFIIYCNTIGWKWFKVGICFSGNAKDDFDKYQHFVESVAKVWNLEDSSKPLVMNFHLAIIDINNILKVVDSNNDYYVIHMPQTNTFRINGRKIDEYSPFIDLQLLSEDIIRNLEKANYNHDRIGIKSTVTPILREMLKENDTRRIHHNGIGLQERSMSVYWFGSKS